MLEVVVIFFVYIVESFIGSVIENFVIVRCWWVSSDDVEG